MILQGKTTEQRFYKNNKDIFLKYFEDQATMSAEAYYDWLVDCNIEKLKKIININKLAIDY
jgi:hypothetical protein